MQYREYFKISVPEIWRVDCFYTFIILYVEALEYSKENVHRSERKLSVKCNIVSYVFSYLYLVLATIYSVQYRDNTVLQNRLIL